MHALSRINCTKSAESEISTNFKAISTGPSFYSPPRHIQIYLKRLQAQPGGKGDILEEIWIPTDLFRNAYGLQL